MERKLRWLAIVPAALAAWWLALIIGMGALRGAEYLCPAEKLVSGFCDVPWWRPLEEAVMTFGAALAAALVVSTVTFVAPTHRRRVVWWALGVGACVAAVVGFLFPVQLCAALGSGALTAWALSRRMPHDA